MTASLGSLPYADVAQRLAGNGLMLRTGPFVQRLRSRLPAVARSVHTLYADHPLADSAVFADFHVRVDRARGVRGVWRPQAEFHFDERQPFTPLPLPQSFAMLEWGLNWCIAQHCHQYLIVHAAVIERDGRAAILPAPPGSGKSTLCAALVHRGWRLCSDELTLIRPQDAAVQALARPVNLKNRSIDLIGQFAPQAVFGPRVPDTHKGTVSHMRAPAASVAGVDLPAQPRWVVFPRWLAGSPATLKSWAKAQAFIELADNAFNYSVLGESGFDTLTRVIDQAECLSFTYDKLDDAVATFERLAEAA
ncbi:MAG: HprK-related kinase A [Rhodocyclaceae bacterium]